MFIEGFSIKLFYVGANLKLEVWIRYSILFTTFVLLLIAQIEVPVDGLITFLLMILRWALILIKVCLELEVQLNF
jgi:hypothetical protein